MAGHNKWSKIKHRKAVVDKRRSKVWTKVARAMTVAARESGPDPSFNVALRCAIDEARYANMPRDVIERAIQKGAGGGDQSNYDAIRYEGYAPGGVAIIVDALTDNRARTATDVRNAFGDHAGNLGTSGCVAYLFQPRGTIIAQAPGLADEAVFEAAIAGGALDAQAPADDDTAWTFTSRVEDFNTLKSALEAAGLTIDDASLGMIAETYQRVEGEAARQVLALIEALEDLDDVQKVHSNADIVDLADES
ncbi:MAG: YebC/PmpR family DNA-binding transcriptional regulator [Phycisphaerales bacterium]|nr:YebC/PmpR family DNA-binding transcriptional regulator [Phycisphaerales bacterium]